MKKVLYYAMCEHDPTSFYRICGVLPYLPKDEYQLVNGCGITDWNWSCFSNVSVFILQRPCFEYHVDMILLAQSKNVKVILDFDDLLTDVDVYNPTYFQYQNNKASLIKCIRLSDEVWVTTQAIKEAYSRYNSNIHIIPNAHNDYVFPIVKKLNFNSQTKRVLWRGGQSHEADVYEIADDIVKLVNDNKDWTFNFWGNRFIYLEQRCGDNYLCIPQMEVMNYFERLMEYNPNIVMYPLCNTEFNKGKSNICWLEGTYAGAAFYSRTELPEFSIKGILDFYNFMDLYAKTLEYHHNLSWQYILDNLLLSNVNKLRHDRILTNL